MTKISTGKTSGARQAGVRAAYATPVLTTYGNVRELTGGQSGNANGDGTSMTML